MARQCSGIACNVWCGGTDKRACHRTVYGTYGGSTVGLPSPLAPESQRQRRQQVNPIHRGRFREPSEPCAHRAPHCRVGLSDNVADGDHHLPYNGSDDIPRLHKAAPHGSGTSARVQGAGWKSGHDNRMWRGHTRRTPRDGAELHPAVADSHRLAGSVRDDYRRRRGGVCGAPARCLPPAQAVVA